MSWYGPQGAEGEGGGRAVDGTLSEGENATARTTTTMPIPPPLPLQEGNSRVSEGNVNDQDQDFQRQLALVQEEKAEDHKRRSQRACQHRLLVRLLVLLLLLLLCFVLGVLPQHYFPMDVSTEIFPTRAFQMGVSGVHAGVWGVLTEKFHSSKLMGLYGAARDVPPLFLI